MKIQPMSKKHIPEVAEVLADAFTAWRIKRRGKDAPRRLRNPECVLPYIELEPNGCFIALDKKKIIGAIFTHVWGKMGWIGTFGVVPEYQSKGIGKDLMIKAINYLDRERNVTRLALETMADSAENIGLYSKLGFKPAFQTMHLTKPISFSKEKENQLDTLLQTKSIELDYYSKEQNREDSLTRIRWLSSKIENGLDFTSEIELIDENNFGDTILLKQDGFIIALATCRTVSRHINYENPDLEIRIILIDFDIKDKEVFDIILLACEKYGFENNKEALRLRINSSYWLAFEYLLKSEFKLRGSLLRMIKFSEDIKSFDHQHEWIVLGFGLTM
ncbi:MAG TPA: GNAT family N-acetyltransferase [candidate division Zixibacteria bacterium]|nr:GNAT family N-acetyltransferase [candidate division Zixibacteria bacterium]